MLVFGLLLWSGLCAISVSSAAAADSNSVPPDLELNSSGGPLAPLGIYSGSLAYYSTAEPDVSWGYPEGSSVSFQCFVDDLPVACSEPRYDGCCPKLVPKRSPRRKRCPRREALWAPLALAQRGCQPGPLAPPYVPPGRTLGYGPFTGWVPIPVGIGDGAHTIKVVATDEDGSDPDPPTVTSVIDRTSPSTPGILEAPARSSRDRTPRFKFTATDDRRIQDEYNQPLLAQLRRLEPAGAPISNASPLGHYLEWRGPPAPRRAAAQRSPGPPMRSKARTARPSSASESTYRRASMNSASEPATSSATNRGPRDTAFEFSVKRRPPRAASRGSYRRAASVSRISLGSMNRTSS